MPQDKEGDADDMDPVPEARTGFHLRNGLETVNPGIAPDQPGTWVPFMKEALKLAVDAWEAGEVPVGCVIVDRSGRIRARSHNQRELLQDPTAHAEMLAITSAADALSSWHMGEMTLVVTLEPCSMCAGAIVLARFERIVFGAFDPKAGACGSVLDVLGCKQLNHNPKVIGGVMEKDCGAILTEFFRQRRKPS